MEGLLNVTRVFYKHIIFDDVRMRRAGMVKLNSSNFGVLRGETNLYKAGHSLIGDYINPTFHKINAHS